MKRSATIFDSEEDKQEVSDVIDNQHKQQSPALPTHHNPQPRQNIGARFIHPTTCSPAPHRGLARCFPRPQLQ